MKTDLLICAGALLLLAAAPAVSLAEEDDDWATRSPLAAGEPLGDCDIHHHEIAVAVEPAPVPALPADKARAILAVPDEVAPAVAPVIAPAAAPPKAPADRTTRLSPATLLTFALIASPGTALPQTAASRD